MQFKTTAQHFKWSNELNYGKVKEDIKHRGIMICNNNDETVFKTCIDIESRMQTALEYFVKSRVDLFKRKTLIEMASHSKFNQFFFNHCTLLNRSLKNNWKNIVNAMRPNKLPITFRSGRALNCIPAKYNVDTIQNYKCLLIEANFKLLQNVLKNKNDFISLYIKKM